MNCTKLDDETSLGRMGIGYALSGMVGWDFRVGHSGTLGVGGKFGFAQVWNKGERSNQDYKMFLPGLVVGYSTL
jgi:asparagine N-glycosylation enzyme membrane subunit Stt3